MKEIFDEIGLTRIESKIYLTLIDLKKATSGSIAKISGVHRRTVIDVLERLILKGLVSYMKENNRRYFSSANPERLLEIIDEYREKLEKKVEQIKPKFDNIPSKEETVFFRGKQGLKTVFDNQIREGKDVFVIGGSKDAERIIDFYFTRYNNLRLKKKIKLNIIFACKRLNKKFPLSELKYLPKKYDTNIATNIYGDNVAIIDWTKLFVIMIRSKTIAQTYKNYFDLIWAKAKR